MPLQFVLSYLVALAASLLLNAASVIGAHYGHHGRHIGPPWTYWAAFGICAISSLVFYAVFVLGMDGYAIVPLSYAFLALFLQAFTAVFTDGLCYWRDGERDAQARREKQAGERVAERLGALLPATSEHKE